MSTTEQPLNEDLSHPAPEKISSQKEEAQPTGMTQSNPAIVSGNSMVRGNQE